LGKQILINQCHNTLTIFGNINNIKKAKFVLINQVLQYFNYIWQYYSKNEMKKRNILNILHMYSREKKVKETTVPNTKQAASEYHT
jgi:aminoglycoside N3'-acetyltransferase